MKQRILTASVILPIFILIMLTNSYPVLFSFIGALSLLGVKEYYKSFNNLDSSFNFIGLLGTVIFIFFVSPNLNSRFIPFSITFSFFVLAISIFRYNENSITNAAITILGILYVPFLLFFVLSVYSIDKWGCLLTWFIFLISWCTDSFACIIGSIIGKRKITPVLSPKKSLEGFVGGTLSTTIICSIIGYLLVFLGYINSNKFIIFCFIIGLFGSIMAQIGDLVASAIKRRNNIKDFGTIFPGHGGILDRFDSVLFVAPTIYLISQIFF